MAKKNSLDSLIEDLDFLSENFNYLMNKSYDDLVAQLVVLIGKSTSYDTGMVRDLIANILMDLDRPDLVKELEHEVYEYWKTRRDREQENSSYDFNKTQDKNHTRYDITIEDYGFYNQQLGKVSDIHPRSNRGIIPHNVSFYCDQLETSSNPSMNKIVNDIHNIIIRLIEKGIK